MPRTHIPIFRNSNLFPIIVTGDFNRRLIILRLCLLVARLWWIYSIPNLWTGNGKMARQTIGMIESKRLILSKGTK